MGSSTQTNDQFLGAIGGIGFDWNLRRSHRPRAMSGSRPRIRRLRCCTQTDGARLRPWPADYFTLKPLRSTTPEVTLIPLYAYRSSPKASLDRERHSAAWALAINSSGKAHERTGLGNRHDRFECQRVAMSVVAIGDSAHRMAKDFDRRFRHVLVACMWHRFFEDLYSCHDSVFPVSTFTLGLTPARVQSF